MYHKLLALLIFATLLAVIAPAAPVPRDNGERDLYFPVKREAKWVYLSGSGSERTEVVTSVKERNGEYIVWTGQEVDGKVEPFETIVVSRKGLFLSGERAATAYAPPMCLLALPLPTGGSWDIKYALTRKDDTTEDVAMTGTHAAKEEAVEVPAGKFEAIRVECQHKDQKGQEWEWTCWYAKGIGVVKLNTGRVTKRLKSFTPGK